MRCVSDIGGPDVRCYRSGYQPHEKDRDGISINESVSFGDYSLPPPEQAEEGIDYPTRADAGVIGHDQLSRGADSRRAQYECDPFDTTGPTLNWSAEAPKPVQVEPEVPKLEMNERRGDQRPGCTIPNPFGWQVAPSANLGPRRIRPERRDPGENDDRDNARDDGRWRA